MAQINSSLEISLDSTIDSEIDFPVKRATQFDDYNANSIDPFVDKVMINYLKHNWTLVGLEDVMKLINEKLEDCDKYPTNKKQILKLFRENRELLEIVYFVECDKCEVYNEVDSESSKNLICVQCKAALKTKETNFFVSIPIEKQIIKSFNDNSEYIKKFDTSGNSTSYTDAHDGSILRSILDKYKNSKVKILSFCLNIDGANKFKSNVLSVWPIQLTQNYLPPNTRLLPDNVIVTGLYYGKTKPNCHDFLLPLVNELARDDISTIIENKTHVFKPLITHCSADLPAKSILQETKQFGSYDGCMYCTNPGELITVKKVKNDGASNKKAKKPKVNENAVTKKFVRYTEGDKEHELRDEVKTLETMLAVQSSKDGKAIDGIKGVSCMVGFQHFNIISGFGVDYLHCVLLGVTKRMLKFCCNSMYNNRIFYIPPKRRDILDRKILAIKPTSNIVRKPRSLEQRLNFKASEFRSMLLYYLPVCLPGFVPNPYVQHIRLLSAGVYNLLKTNITKDEVNETEDMLNRFVKQHQDLYGKENMVTNIHLIKHLCESVRKLGPLWCHSAFPFERNNGCLLKTINGTTDVLHQMSSKYVLKKSLMKNFEATKGALTDICFLGKSVPIVEKKLSVLNVTTSKYLNLSNVSLDAYKRVQLKKKIFTSVLYTRPKKSVDYFVKLIDGNIGAVKFYFKNDEEKYVIIDAYKIIGNIFHILKVQKTNITIMAPINFIEGKLIFMEVGLNKYAVSPPNFYEKE